MFLGVNFDSVLNRTFVWLCWIVLYHRQDLPFGLPQQMVCADGIQLDRADEVLTCELEVYTTSNFAQSTFFTFGLDNVI